MGTRTLTHRWPRAVLAWTCLAALAAGAGCAAGQRSVLAVSLDRTGPPTLQEGADTPRVLASVAWVLINPLGLPLSRPLHAYFYSTQEAFELGLVTDARVETWMAKDQARFAWGVGTYYGIFLREDKLASASLLSRVGLIAHELTHVSQYELAGGRRGSSDQWLREGFAEWVKFQVLEHLGLRPYAESRSGVAGEVRRAGAVDQFPELTELATNRGWTAARIQFGRIATYHQAFLATDRLVARRGHQAAIEYFRRFGRFDDREGNFLAAFGLPVGEFAKEFRLSLSTLIGGTDARAPRRRSE